VQTCVVHLVRYCLRMTADQDGKSVAADLKKIYQAATESEALRELEAFQAKWEKQYPLIAKSWRANWARIKPMDDVCEAFTPGDKHTGCLICRRKASTCAECVGRARAF
jgi:transposase-like protein